MVELRVTPSKLVPLPEAVANITSFLLQRCALCRSTAIENFLKQGVKGVFVNGCLCIAPDTSISPSRNKGLPDTEKACKKSEVVASNNNHLLAYISLLAKDNCIGVVRKQFNVYEHGGRCEMCFAPGFAFVLVAVRAMEIQ